MKKNKKLTKVISYVMIFLMTVGLVNIPAIIAKAAVAVNVITNSGFEAGTTDWVSWGGADKISASTTEHHGGAQSLLSTGKSGSWQGPNYDLMGKVVSGTTYDISFWVKSTSDDHFKFTLKQVNGSGEKYIQMLTPVAVTASTWTNVTGKYTFDFQTDVTALNIYAEATDNPNQDFYIDDVKFLGDPVGTAPPAPYVSANVITNPDFESGTTDWISWGGADKISVSTTEHHAGAKSLLSSGKTASYMGPNYDLKGKVTSGTTYDISFWVKTTSDDSFKLTLKQTNGNSTENYIQMMNPVSVHSGTWTEVTGQYTFDFQPDLAGLNMYVEDTTNANQDFYIDDVSMLPELITNSGFEQSLNVDSTIPGWIARGNVTDCKIALDTASVHSGTKSVKVTGRTGTWQGVAQEMFGKLEKGKTYHMSLWVMYDNGPDTHAFNLSADRKVGSSDNYDNIITPALSDNTLTKGVWKKLEGDYSVGTDLNFTSLLLYVETPYLAAPATSDLMDFYVDDFSVTQGRQVTPISIQQDIPSLADTFKDYFPIGVAVQPSRLDFADPYQQLLAKHFNSIVAENCMKWEVIEPTENTFDFSGADALADYAIAHKMQMRGHNLLWHIQIPDWVFQDPTHPTIPATKEVLLGRLKNHIDTILNHFKDKYGANNPIVCWDTVNEVIGDDGQLRNSKWLQIVGDEYIKDAFKYARAADPTEELVINDYSTEQNGIKTDKLCQVVTDINAAYKTEHPEDSKLLIQAIGMQMHYSIDSPPVEAIKTSIDKFAALGVKVQVTELDMSTSGQTDANALLQQARRYKQTFDLFKQEKDKIQSVTIWGISDDISWITGIPLFFDKKLQAKPAFWALVDPTQIQVGRQSIQASNGTPTIDVNNMDNKWLTAKGIEAKDFVTGSTGATATVKTMWDENNLYINATVSDATPNPKDSIEFFVDKNRDKATSYQGDDMKYVVNSDGTGSAGFNFKFKKVSGGYTVQATLPIADIKPALNKMIGFDVRVNDDKGNGTIDSEAIWNDYTNNQDTDPSKLGDIVLSGTSRLVKATEGTPTIDGTIDDMWKNSEQISTNVWVTGTSGSTAKCRAMWDDKNFYILSEVTDKLLSDKSVNVYEQDSVEVFVDQNNHKSASYEADDGQYRVNYKNLQSFGANKHEGFKSATSITDTGYIVEEAIPFTAITPSDGGIIGFDVQVNNDETGSGSRSSVSMWNDGTGGSWNSTANYGNLQFVKAVLAPVVSGSSGGSVVTSVPAVVPVVTKIDSNSNVVATFDSSKIDKNNVNVIQIDQPKPESKVQVQIPASSIGTGTGSFEISTKALSLSIPTSIIDSSLLSSGGTLQVSQNLMSAIESKALFVNTPIGTKNNGKFFTLGMAVYDSSNNVVSTIHNFATGKSVAVTIDLSNDDIKGLDSSKLSAFYFDIVSKKWVDIGGSFDSVKMTYTFNTTHFTDFTIMQKSAVSRLAGVNRIETSIAIAKEQYTATKPDAVVIATANDFADALSGSGLAYKYNAPLLLVNKTVSDSQSVLDYITTNLSKDKNIYILGGTGVVCKEISDYLMVQGYKIIRLGGKDRYETNQKIVDNLNVAKGTSVVIATGNDFADALSISSIADIKGFPVLLNGKENLSASTSSYITNIEPTTVYVIGGVGVLNTSIEDQIKKLKGDIKMVRLGGKDRYETSMMVLDYFNLPSTTITIATGIDFPDALSGSVLAARKNSGILLVDNNDITKQKELLSKEKITNIIIFGGESVIKSDIATSF